MKKLSLALLLAASLLLAACGQGASAVSSSVSAASSPAAASSQPAVSSQAPIAVPDFTLQANNGEEVSLSDYRGKVVILNFWASWCPPCKEEMPAFQQLQEEYAGSEDTVLLMLNQTDGQRETKEKADQYLADNEYTFLNLYDTGEVGGAIFGLTGIPATVIVDTEGNLAGYTLGATTYEKVVQMAEGAR
ncbi:MAG: TlpA family protein disulfide reductase [Oscillospiraceae bacterium]